MPSWDEPKRRKNIKAHGLDFEGAEAIWDNFTITREDTRERLRRKPAGDVRDPEWRGGRSGSR